MNEDAIAFKGRQFICACGKNYLSYAALFTHIKQKHDGQPPGPITRPRSERKRGRPRKNPQADNEASISQSENNQKGFTKHEDNHHPQKQQDHEKTKKAAQLLGCGGFVAFTAYRPQPIRSSPKKGFQSAKKSFSRKGSGYNQLIQRKLSHPIIQNNQQLDHPYPNHMSLQQPQTSQNICLKLKLQQKNKCQLIKLFTNHPQNTKNWPIKSQQLQIFKKINVNYQKPQQIKNIQQVSINIGMALFLNQVKQLLKKKQINDMTVIKKQICSEEKDKQKQEQSYNNNYNCNQNMNINMNDNQNNNDNPHNKSPDVQNFKIHQQQYEKISQHQKQVQKQILNQYQFDQVLLLVAFLLKYIVELGPDGINQLQAKPIFQIVQYLPKFTLQYINQQIKLYHLQNFDIFRGLNPVKFIVFLNNWLAIKKNLYTVQIKTSLQTAHMQQQNPAIKLQTDIKYQQQPQTLNTHINNQKQIDKQAYKKTTAIKFQPVKQQLQQQVNHGNKGNYQNMKQEEEEEEEQVQLDDIQYEIKEQK